MYANAYSLDPDLVFRTTPVRSLYYWLESRVDRLTREMDAREEAKPNAQRTYNDADLMALVAKDRARNG